MKTPPDSTRENAPPLARLTFFNRFHHLLLTVIILLGCSFAPLSHAVQTIDRTAPADFRTDRILVKPQAGQSLASLHALMGVKTLKSFPRLGYLQLVQVPPGHDIRTLLEAYRKSGLVEYAEPDYIVHALATPNDFRYQDGSLWNLHNTGIYGGVIGADIHAPQGWDIQRTAAGVIVAVIDTGVRYTHEDLAPNMWVNPGESCCNSSNGVDDDGDGYVDDVHGINTIFASGDPFDDHGHGTHVAGIIGGVGNNTVGITGVAWQVPIMACKFIDAQGQGSISDAIACISYAQQKGARIINASWGAYNFNSTALYDAINSLRADGIIFVAAAGNDNNDNDANPLYPASYDLDNIISVAATDRTDDRAAFSNYGANSVDLAAPGSPVFSCWNGSDSDYRYSDGTSMAAPQVAGACALLWAHLPALTYQQVISQVLSSADPLPALSGRCVTGGRLNLEKALSSVPLASGAPATPLAGAGRLAVASP